MALTLASWDATGSLIERGTEGIAALVKNGVHTHQMSFKARLPDEIKLSKFD